MEKQYNRQIREREGWSTELANGQRSPTLSMGWRVKPIGRWSTGRSADRKRRRRKSRRYTKGKNTVEAGQSTVGNGSESVLGEFDSCMSLFLFLVVIVFFRCK
jgi:hypothetical protein